MGSDMIDITEMHARCVRAHEAEGLPQSVRDSLADVPHLLAAVIRLRGDLADRDCGIESALRICQIDSLRAAVRAADAMARALLDKSNGAHECNGGPERCWHCADAESDRAVVSAYDQARAKCGEVT